MLTCELKNAHQVSVTLPAVLGVFIEDITELAKKLAKKGKTTASATKAHITAVNKYNDKYDTDHVPIYKVLIDFSCTGEDLTNTVWTDGKEEYGNIRPVTMVYERSFICNGKVKNMTYLIVSWLIARVELTKRTSQLVTSKKKNMIADDLSSDEDVDEEGTTEMFS